MIAATSQVAWHTLSEDEAIATLGSDADSGLASAEATRRLETYGPNEIPERGRQTALGRLVRQFTSFLILLLIVAAIVAAAIGELLDAGLILAIVLLNGILGFIQESRAETALAALRRQAAPQARVVRDGHVQEIGSRLLVPGDLVLLEAGNLVPADLRLIETANLKVDEASLTGESVPVDKLAHSQLDIDTPLAERRNLAFMGTIVTYGRGSGIVIATGLATQFGQIASALQSYEEQVTPLQRRLEGLGRQLGLAAVAICGVIFAIGILREQELLDTFLVAVSLAVAAVPEGLPAVVTIVLAVGLGRMARRNALVRHLSAVETLGSATVICTDKTGTLTVGEMSVVHIQMIGSTISVTGEGYIPRGELLADGQPLSLSQRGALRHLLTGVALCNDARIEPAEAGGWQVVGDPTEKALVVLSAKAGLWKHELEAKMPRHAEVPFSSERKLMTTVHPDADGGWIAYTKGAPDVLLERCSLYAPDEAGEQPLTEDISRQILSDNDSLAADGLRVLAVAMRRLDSLPAADELESVERGLTFLGLIGMIDPPRPEVLSAIQRCQTAGIRVVMVTGDHARTALSIGRQLGIADADTQVLTGRELDNMSDSDLSDAVKRTSIYARVSPQHKVRIVEALQRQGEVVAVTGDGVNDALALTRAQIGVAMGITGTDVAKGASDMVLTDDNFASIVAAVEEGRTIYGNIRRFVVFLLTGNIGEVLVIFVAMVAGLPLPLRAVHILWVNLVTDSAPALALGMEPGRSDVMREPPRPPQEPVVTRWLGSRLALLSVLVSGATLVAFLIGYKFDDGNLDAARTLAFTTLILSQVFIAHAARSLSLPLATIGVFSNRYMWLASIVAIVLLILAVYAPPLQAAFQNEPLSLVDWLIAIGLASAPAIAIEAGKTLRW